MGAVSPVVGLVEMGMGVYQKKRASQYQKYADEAMAVNLEEDALHKEDEARTAIREGAVKIAELHNETRGGIAVKKVKYAASGVRIDRGSALDNAADQAAWGEYGKQKLAYEAEMRSWGLRRDAARLRDDAAAIRGKSRQGGFDKGYELFKIGGSLLKG